MPNNWNSIKPHDMIFALLDLPCQSCLRIVNWTKRGGIGWQDEGTIPTKKVTTSSTPLPQQRRRQGNTFSKSIMEIIPRVCLLCLLTNHSDGDFSKRDRGRDFIWRKMPSYIKCALEIKIFCSLQVTRGILVHLEMRFFRSF